jgi:chaperonin GroES
MPSIDGGFYGMGFGSLLMSNNSAINTIINQLIDAGTLNNRQNGFLGRGLKLGSGKGIQLKSGEWKPVVATGDDLRKNVFPMPIREPSQTLFALLGLLIDTCW